jgi:hypothetical protein
MSTTASVAGSAEPKFLRLAVFRTTVESGAGRGPVSAEENVDGGSDLLLTRVTRVPTGGVPTGSPGPRTDFDQGSLRHRPAR